MESSERDSDELRTRSVQLSEGQWSDVEAEARERQISGSAVVRDAVRSYFAERRRQREVLAA